MSNALKAKLKFDSKLTETLRKETQSNDDDARILEYYNMKAGEQMRVLIIPDVNGQLWTKYSYHGGRKLNLDKATKSKPSIIRCHRVTDKGDCSICNEHMFPLYSDAKELATTDPVAGKLLKEHANKFQTTDVTYMSVIVLESPCEIAYPDDGNQVKLIKLPKKIEDMIRTTLDSGELTQDDLCKFPLVIRKKENDAKMADYGGSSFSRTEVSDDELAFFEDQVVEQYDLSNLDSKLISPPVTVEEQMEWLVTAEAAIEASNELASKKGSSDKPSGGKGAKSANVGDALRSKMAKKEPDPEQEQEPEQEPEQEEQSQPEPEEKKESVAEKQEEQKAPAMTADERTAALRAKLLARKS